MNETPIGTPASKDAMVGNTTDIILNPNAPIPAVPTEAHIPGDGQTLPTLTPDNQAPNVEVVEDHSASVGRPAELFENAGEEKPQDDVVYEGMPDKFKNNVPTLIQSYKDLERKFGNFAGAPEEYEISVPDGLEEFTLSHEDPFVKDFVGILKEGNASQEFFNKISHAYVKYQQMEAESLENDIMETYEKDLQELGKDGVAEIKEAASWAKEVLPPHVYKELAEVANFDVSQARLVRAFYELYQQKGYNKLPVQSDNIENTLDKKVRAQEMMGDNRYGAFGQDAFTQKVDNLYKELYS